MTSTMPYHAHIEEHNQKRPAANGSLPFAFSAAYNGQTLPGKRINVCGGGGS